jgi:hypothetical protein
MTGKRTYERPKVSELGSVRDMTLGGGGGFQQDTFAGGGATPSGV